MWVSLFDAARYSSHYKLHVYMLTFFTVIEFWQHHHKYKLRVLWVICSTLPSPHNTHTLSLSLSLSLLLSLSLSLLSLSLSPSLSLLTDDSAQQVPPRANGRVDGESVPNLQRLDHPPGAAGRTYSRQVTRCNVVNHYIIMTSLICFRKGNCAVKDPLLQ